MSSADQAAPLLAAHDDGRVLTDQWRTLTRAATGVALLTSPAVFLWFHQRDGWGVWTSLAATAGVVIGFRGLIEVTFRRILPWPSLFGTEDARIKEEDVLGRRRSWFWRRMLRFAVLILLGITLIYVVQTFTKSNATWTGAAGSVGDAFAIFKNPTYLSLFIQLPIFFLFNFLIFMGPMLMMGISQIRGFEPGDADWGVRLGDVRGQSEAKEEVRRIVSLWESGEAFVKAGGKRERGILFLGAPGTGKTMLAKAIATSFNSPFVTIPGSGFAQTFIGLDAIIVRYLARKAKRLAHKWGGQCIVFIDEIDAVGLRRSALGGAPSWSRSPASFHDFLLLWSRGVDHLERRPDPGDSCLARPTLRAARAGAPCRLVRSCERDRQPGVSRRHDGRRRSHSPSTSS